MVPIGKLLPDALPLASTTLAPAQLSRYVGDVYVVVAPHRSVVDPDETLTGHAE